MNQKQLNAQIYAEASSWLIEFRSGDVGTSGRQEFYDWLRRSPEHMRAYIELAAIWNEGSRADRRGVFDDASLASDMQQQANVVAVGPQRLKGVAPPVLPEASRRRRTPHWFALAASLLIAVASAGGWFYAQRGTYYTGIGEQRTLALSDGSRVELNARSKLRVRYSAQERSIDLLAGQALFHVAKDKHRPLIVTSDDVRVRAVGTQFDVYRKRQGTVVTVVEGRVAVERSADNALSIAARPTPESSASSGEGVSAAVGEASIQVQQSKPRLLLAAGEQALVTTHSAVKQQQPNVQAATAWASGQLIFHAATLQDVAEEFNRYNATPLVIHDQRLASFKVTGIFSSTDPTSLIRFLEARPGIAVTSDGHEISISQKP